MRFKLFRHALHCIKLYSFLTLASITLGILLGCNNGQSPNNSREHEKFLSKPDRQAHYSTEIFGAQAEAISYPVVSSNTLSVALPIETGVSETIPPFFQTLSESTGIPVEYSFSPALEYQSAVRSFLSTETAPDLIWSIDSDTMKYYVDKSSHEPLLILNDYLPFCAPDYINTISQYPEIQKDCILDDGSIIQFMVIMETPVNETRVGPFIRQDLLQKYEMEIPQTYKELEEFLRAVQNDVSSPLFLVQDAYEASNFFASGFGVSAALRGLDNGFYQKDGVIHYGPAEEDFQDFLLLLSQWYADHLISHRFLDFVDFTTSNYELKIANGESAVFFSTYNNAVSLEAFSEIDNFQLAFLPDPIKEHGGTSHLAGQPTKSIYSSGFSVSSACEHPEDAVKFINYLYTEDGYLLSNYGAEGITYTLEGKEAVYTDEALKNTELLQAYTSLNPSGIIASNRYTTAEYASLLAANAVWFQNKDTTDMLPTTLAYDAESYDELIRKIADLLTYSSGEIIKFISGDKPLSEFEEFRGVLYDLGLQDCIDIIQSSIDAYNSR